MKFDDENIRRDIDSNDDYIIEDVSSNDDEFVFDLNSFANMDSDSDNLYGSKHSREAEKKGFFGKLLSKMHLDNSGEKKNWVRIALTCFLVFVITGCIVLCSMFIYIFSFVDYSINEDLNDLTLNYTTTIYVRDNENAEYKEYQRLHGGFNRIWVAYNKEKAEANAPDYDGVPMHLANAFISIEDQHFYKHEGVDWKRTFSAFANMFLHFSDSNFGGSTITQQLVKNLTGDNEHDAMRKVREIMRARYLESMYYKDTILECYMNTVAMGRDMYGVEVASNYYFSKSANELTIAESATLAAIVKGPTIYRPDKNPENNKQRRELVLKAMYEQDYITKDEYEQAMSEEVKITADETALKVSEINNYFVESLITEVTADIAEKYNYDKTHAAKNFYNGGYKIYCTMDPKVQEAIDEVFTDKNNIKISKKTGKQLQGAMTVVDYKGNIVGVAGGLGEKTVNRGLNRAVAQPRQAGSSTKPLTAYAPALENNIITYSSLVSNNTKKYGGWKVKGSGGKVTVARALQRSFNVPPTELINKMTPQASYDFVTGKLGFKNYDPVEDVNLSSLALGGSYGGVTTTEEAAAFAIFGNGGIYYEPTTYAYITDQHDKVILDNRDRRGESVISESTSVIMNKLLQNVTKSGGTGAKASSYVTNMPIFGKTGTTDSTMNKWFCGGSPYYVASCWIGFDTAEKISDSGLAIRLWGNVMKRINRGKKVISFPESEFVTCRAYCTATGLVAKDGCPSTAVGWYKTDYMPTCNVHSGHVLGSTSSTQTTSSNTSSTASGTSSATTSTVSTSSTTSTSTSSSASSVASSSSEQSTSSAVSSGATQSSSVPAGTTETSARTVTN